VLQFTSSLPSTMALGLLAALAMISWTTPITAFYFIACSQTLPFPEDAMLNPTQLGFVVWPVVAVVTSKRIDVRRFSALVVLLPFLIWYAVVGGETRELFSLHGDFLKVGLYALIACHYVNVARGRYLKCLLGLAVGACTVIFAFWAYTAGLPVELATYGGQNSRGGFARIGSARADAVMVWPPLLLGVFSIIGIAVVSLKMCPESRQTGVLRWYALAVYFLSIPPLMSTMSHGSYFGFLLMSIFAVMAVKQSMRGRRLALREKRQLVKFGLIPLALVIVFYSLNLFQSRDRVSGLLSYYGKIRKKTTIAASRTEVWSYSLRTICRYPISGVGSARWKEEIPSGYRAGGRYDSHNVFLEYGRSTGVMGMVLIAMFFFYPVWSLGKHRSRNLYLPFYMAYFSMFIFWMVLSYAFYKPFWALWIMMSMMSLEHRALFMQSATRNRK